MESTQNPAITLTEDQISSLNAQKKYLNVSGSAIIPPLGKKVYISGNHCELEYIKDCPDEISHIFEDKLKTIEYLREDKNKYIQKLRKLKDDLDLIIVKWV